MKSSFRAKSFSTRVASDSVDIVFCSNFFFEHLPDKAALETTLAEIRTVLRPGGRLLVLQPNIRLVGGAYWNFIDHHVALTDRSLAEACEISGFTVQEVIPRSWPVHDPEPPTPEAVARPSGSALSSGVVVSGRSDMARCRESGMNAVRRGRWWTGPVLLAGPALAGRRTAPTT